MFLGPLEDGIPLPKPSVEAGVRLQTIGSSQSNGILGTIAADHIEISTGQGVGANLQGSHIFAKHLVAQTDFLKMGGTSFTAEESSSVFKATGGVDT